LKKFIAIGSMETPLAAIGNQVEMEVTVEYQRQRARAEVVPMPFYDPVQKKA
jgi:glycine cleavage system aminomethyltransferase T